MIPDVATHVMCIVFTDSDTLGMIHNPAINFLAYDSTPPCE